MMIMMIIREHLKWTTQPKIQMPPRLRRSLMNQPVNKLKIILILVVNILTIMIMIMMMINICLRSAGEGPTGPPAHTGGTAKIHPKLSSFINYIQVETSSSSCCFSMIINTGETRAARNQLTLMMIMLMEV